MGSPSRHNLWNKCLSMAMAFQKKKVKRSIHATCNGSKVLKKMEKAHWPLCNLGTFVPLVVVQRWPPNNTSPSHLEKCALCGFQTLFPNFTYKRPLSHPQKPWEQFLERTIILEKNYSSENSLLPSASPPPKGSQSAEVL